MNRCECGASLRFFGISIRAEWLRWSVCDLCGWYYAQTADYGVKFQTRSVPPRRWFMDKRRALRLDMTDALATPEFDFGSLAP